MSEPVFKGEPVVLLPLKRKRSIWDRLKWPVLILGLGVACYGCWMLASG